METAPSDGEVTAASLLDFKCNVITSGTVAKRSAILAVGGFEHQRARAHDFHLWLRMAKNGAKIGYQKKALLKYRVHLDSLSGNAVSRVQREIDVFNRVRDSIELAPDETAILERRLAGLEADLQVESGKSYLLQRDFSNARKAFAEANRRRPTLKMTAISLASIFAPGMLLKHFRSRRPDDVMLAGIQASSR